MSENEFAAVPVAVYGIVLTAAGFAWLLLQATLLHVQGENPLLAAAVGTDRKGRTSLLVYCAGIALSFANRWLGIAGRHQIHDLLDHQGTVEASV